MGDFALQGDFADLPFGPKILPIDGILVGLSMGSTVCVTLFTSLRFWGIL